MTAPLDRLSGVMVGLGFETKMRVAFLVVPGIAARGCGSPRGGRRGASIS